MKPYRGLTKEGKWVYGWYVKVNNTHYIVEDNVAGYRKNDGTGLVIHRVFEVIPETIKTMAEVIYEAECPACGEMVEFENIGWKICPHCGKRKAKFDVTWEIVKDEEIDEEMEIPNNS